MTTKKVTKGTKEVETESSNEDLLKIIKELESKIDKIEKEDVRDNTWIEPINTTSKKNILLPGKKVTIIPILKSGNNFIKDPDQATMLRGTGKSIAVPLNRKTGKLIDPLNSEEKEYLEEVLGLNLNVYTTEPEGCFYRSKKAQIRLKKTGVTIDSAAVTLNLGNPFEYLLYKIALSSPRVANKWSDRHNIRYEFVIKDETSELAETVAHSDKEDVVTMYLLENKTNKKALYDLIRIYGHTNFVKKKVNKDNSVEWLYTELKKIKSSIKGLRELFNIISLNNSSPRKLDMMVLLQDAIECGALHKKGNEYSLPGGNPIGYSMDETIDFLDNKENQTIKLKVVNTVENYLKNNR